MADRTPGAMLLIVNPRAGRGTTDVLDRLVDALADLGHVPDVARTTRAGEATEIARRAVGEGRSLVVAVGGDGTVHEVVNGLAGEGAADELPALGVVPAGSGCDLVRTFGLDRGPEVLARHLVGPGHQPIDLGRVRLTGPDGRPRTCLFANIAEVGFGGAVARTAARLPARLGERRYRAGIVLAWGGFRRVPLTIRHDGGVHEAALSNVVVANGQFFGGGLNVAPRALPDDGRFELQAWGGTVTDVLRASRLLRDGSHLRRDDVRSWPATRVEVDGPPDVAVEADGELLGTLPAVFDVVGHAVRLKV